MGEQAPGGSLRLAELAGLDDGQRSIVYYTSLLGRPPSQLRPGAAA